MKLLTEVVLYKDLIWHTFCLQQLLLIYFLIYLNKYNNLIYIYHFYCQLIIIV